MPGIENSSMINHNSNTNTAEFNTKQNTEESSKVEPNHIEEEKKECNQIVGGT